MLICLCKPTHSTHTSTCHAKIVYVCPRGSEQSVNFALHCEHHIYDWCVFCMLICRMCHGVLYMHTICWSIIVWDTDWLYISTSSTVRLSVARRYASSLRSISIPFQLRSMAASIWCQCAHGASYHEQPITGAMLFESGVNANFVWSMYIHRFTRLSLAHKSSWI